MLKAIFDTLST